MGTFILVVHFAACILMIIAVLLQPGKSSGMALFGGGSDALFSTASGTSFMRKLTIGLAVTITLTSLALTVNANRREMSSVVDSYPLQSAPVQAETPAPAPAQPSGK